MKKVDVEPMALNIGAHLGPYEVISLIGAGGMGEVYRARDTRLQRDVALKVLPEAFAADPERLARFQREAQVLASLNHPNIAIIHGLEEADGVKALVLELVEGPTLAQRIAQGPIPVDEALPMARQIAEALEAAHEHGIIHRDLKPANVKVKDDGTVKVLDFGLAKLTDPSGAGSVAQGFSPGAVAPSQAPTLTTPAATRMGVVMGTAAYMSPEQARGRPVDKRADIWAFGCVLYEMLTGRRAFEGEQVTDVLARVLERAPDFTALPATLNTSIRTLLERCLEKDRRNRWHDIADIRLEIERVQRDPAAAAGEAFGAVQKTSRNAVPWTIAAFAAGAVLAGLAVWSLRPAPAAETDPVRFSFVGPAVGRFSSGIGKMAISPDGSRIAYVANGQLHIRALDQLEGTPIAGTRGAGNPFFSPDGRWIGFHADGKLQRVPLGGGAPLTIASAGIVFGASWGPGDVIIFGGGVGTGLLRVLASGGTPAPLTFPEPEKGEVNHGLPHILPGGRSVLFTIGTGEGSRVALLSLETGAWRELLPAGAGAQYLSAGHLLFSEKGNLRLVAFDADAGEVDGPIVPALDGIVWENHAGLETAWFAVSRTGNLVYVSGDEQELSTRPVWVDRSGRETPIEAPPAFYVGPRIASNGRYIGFSRIGMNGVGELWVLDVDGGRIFPVAAQGANYNATWSPDVEGRLTFTSNGDLFETLVGQLGAPVRLLQRDNYQYPLSWSPDGRFLAFMEIATAGTDLWIMSREGHPTRLLESTSNAGGARFSPEGDWLAYLSDETGQQEVYVRRYPGSERGQQVSRNGGREPVWSADGRTLFYRSGNRMMAVEIVTQPVFRSGTPVELWDRPYWSQELFGVHNYDVAADGRFLMLRLQDESAAAPATIHVVLNWLHELQERGVIP